MYPMEPLQLSMDRSALILTVLVISHVHLIKGGVFLPLCSENTTETRLCKIDDDHCPVWPPKPWPVRVTPLLSLKDILDIDESKKTIQLFARITFFWFDYGINVDTPGDKK